jgi:hypothetical protein
VKSSLVHLHKEFGPNLIVFHGDAEGLDTIVRQLCPQLGIQQVRVPANWGGLGPAAGSHRDQLLLDLATPIARLVAFPTEESIGTWHMVELALKADVDIDMESAARAPKWSS